MSAGVRVSTIQTVAGTSEGGYSGDGEKAHAACLNEPKAVALEGELFIANTFNHRIRRIVLYRGRRRC